MTPTLIAPGAGDDRRAPAPAACSALHILTGAMGLDDHRQPITPRHLYRHARCTHCGQREDQS